MRREAPLSTDRRKKPRRSAEKAASARPQAKPKKRTNSLSLSPEAIARGEAYSRRHGTKLSKLVGDFLRALPLVRGPEHELSPAVRRLYGVASGAKASVDDHREHLRRKYAGD